MNEWEIIGRFVDLDNRLRTLEGRPTVQEKPQPVATLCEEVSRFLGTIHDWHTINLGKARLQEALTAERKRAVLVGELLEYLGFYINAEEGAVSERDYYELVRRYRALDAFDKGAENG